MNALDSTPDDDGIATVFVNWIDEREDLWAAVWQRGPIEHRDMTGTKAEVLEWARRQPADHHLIFDSGRGYLPLP